MVKPRPSAAVTARRRRIRLCECIEDQLVLMRGDADPGVGHDEAEHEVVPTRSWRRQASPEDDFTGGRELDRVREQVDQDLPEATGVPEQAVGQTVVDVHHELERLLVRLSTTIARAIIAICSGRELGDLELDLAGVDLGELEQRGDDLQQMAARRLHGAEPLTLLLAERRIEDQIGQTENRALIGVRISWLTWARNSSLSRLAISAR